MFEITMDQVLSLVLYALATGAFGVGVFVHGKNATFQLDNSGGSLIDLSAYFNTSALQRAIDAAETTVYTKGNRTYIPGLAGARIPIGGHWDPTLDAHMEGVLAAEIAGTLVTASFEFGPAGSTSGNIKYTGECILISYDIPTPNDGLVDWSGELQVTDAITRGTY